MIGNDALAEFALDYAQSNGKQCEYVEVRSEINSTDTVAFINGKLHIGNLPIELTSDAFARKSGINIRIIADGGMGMSSTNQLTKNVIMESVDRAYRTAKRSGKQRKTPLRMSHEKIYEKDWQSEYKINPMDVTLEEKIQFLQGFVNIFKEKYPIEYIHIFILISEQRDTYFISSEGARIKSHVPRVAFIPVIIGIKGGGQNEEHDS